MSENITVELLFHGLMAFNKPQNGPLMAAFLRGLRENPLSDHVVSVTLQEMPGRALPGDVLPFPIPLIMRPTEDIHLTVEGASPPPLTFDPNHLITLNGEGFHPGEALEIGDRFFPRFYLNNGIVSGADNHEITVIQPDGSERDEIISFILLAQIPLGPSNKAVLQYGSQSWEFYNRGDGTKYRLWVSHVPNRPDQVEQSHHAPSGHFQFYYGHGFPGISNRFDLKPKGHDGRLTYQRPCIGVHIA